MRCVPVSHMGEPLGPTAHAEGAPSTPRGGTDGCPQPCIEAATASREGIAVSRVHHGLTSTTTLQSREPINSRSALPHNIVMHFYSRDELLFLFLSLCSCIHGLY
jgi:hypothetical protein